jgi:signal transduction histidine kinase
LDSLSEQVKVSVTGEIFAGGGKMGALMRSIDWSTTPLGPVENWPQSLRTSVSICLASHFPMLIWWGPELVMLYNDAYRPMLGATKHPAAMGQRGRECWPEIWHIIGPMLEGVLTEGQATWSENQLLLLDRNGYIEECYFTFSYSPIRDETGGVGGVFTAVTETTRQILSERRLRTLRELAANTSEAKSVEDACRIAMEVMASNIDDIPFALFFLLDEDGQHAHLVGTSGTGSDMPADPLIVDVSKPEENAEGWPLWQVVQSGKAELVENLAERFGALPALTHYDSPRSALVLPVARPGQQDPYGSLVAGISPLRELDDDYRSFLSLVAGHVATAIANARTHLELARSRLEMAQLYKQAQEAIAARDELLSIVSHDLKNPLATIKGFAQLLQRAASRPNTEANEQILDGLKRIDATATKMTTLINELMDVVFLQTNRPLKLDLRPTDLIMLAHQSVIEYQQTTERHKFRIETSVPTLIGLWDATRLERVLANLLSNAIKYSPEGNVITVTLAREDEKEASWAVLAVQDEGIGIPAADLPHIFVRFHRASNVAAQIKGTGIGLVSVHHVVEQHGGIISVTSKEGEGSTITVRLPLLPPEKERDL